MPPHRGGRRREGAGATDWYWILGVAGAVLVLAMLARAPLPWDRVWYARRQARARAEPVRAAADVAPARAHLQWDTEEAGYLVPLLVGGAATDDDDEAGDDSGEEKRTMAVLDTGSCTLALKTEACVHRSESSDVDDVDDAEACPRTGAGAHLPTKASDATRGTSRAAYGTQVNTFVSDEAPVRLEVAEGSAPWSLGERTPVQRVVAIAGESSSNLLGTGGRLLVEHAGAHGWTMRLDRTAPTLELGTDVSEFMRCARLPNPDERGFIRCAVRSMWSGEQRLRPAPTVAIIDTGTTCTYMPSRIFDQIDTEQGLTVELGSDPRHVVTLRYDPQDLVDFEYPSELAVRRDEGELDELFGPDEAPHTIMIGVLLLRNKTIHVRDNHIFVRNDV